MSDHVFRQPLHVERCGGSDHAGDSGRVVGAVRVQVPPRARLSKQAVTVLVRHF